MTATPEAGFVARPVAGVAMLLWACDPDQPERLYAPFFHAATMAALDVPVEIHFTARSVLLLAPGVAAGLVSAHHPKRVLDAMQEAVDQGARLLACPDALRAHGVEATQLIGLCSGLGGSLAYALRAIDRDWRVISY